MIYEKAVQKIIFGYFPLDNHKLKTIVSFPSKEERGLLDRSTARYFYKQLKQVYTSPTGNLIQNLFSEKYAFKNNLELLGKKVFVSNKYNT